MFVLSMKIVKATVYTIVKISTLMKQRKTRAFLGIQPVCLGIQAARLLPSTLPGSYLELAKSSIHPKGDFG